MSETLGKKSRLQEESSDSTCSKCTMPQGTVFWKELGICKKLSASEGGKTREEQVVWNEAEKQTRDNEWSLLCQFLRVNISDICMLSITVTN